MAKEPIFNAPTAVVATLGLLVAVHAGLSLVPEAMFENLVQALAFNPARFRSQGPSLPGGWPASIWSFVTHQLVHGDIGHLVINCAWMLAFGGAIAQRVGNARFVVLGLLSGIAGALMFLIFNLGTFAPVVGASGAVSGLMGGAFRFLFSALQRGELERFREDPSSVPRMSLAQMARDRRALASIGIWIAINLLVALAAPLFTSAGGIAWEAHLGGFLFGLLTFQWFDPPRPRLIVTNPAPSTLH